MRDDPSLRRLVEEWELKLNLMVTWLPPEEPPARVWRAISKRVAKTGYTLQPWWNRLAVWRTIAVAAIVASIGLTYLIGHRPVPAPDAGPTRVAVLTNAEGRPAWVLTLVASPSGGLSLRYIALQAQPVGDDQSLELWLLPRGGGAPISAGLLAPDGRGTQPLPAALRPVIDRVGAVAVSLEAKGGSPTGAPTGPVLYQGEILRM